MVEQGIHRPDGGAGGWVVVGLALSGLLAAGGCAAQQPQTVPVPPTETPPATPIATPVETPVEVRSETPAATPAEEPGPALQGLASWYGVKFHGRRAADGSRYNMYEFTAAHRTLEFGTRVRVINLENDRAVEVTITDRGPFVDDRIIDVSFAAAQRLGMIGRGVTRVRLEIVD